MKIEIKLSIKKESLQNDFLSKSQDKTSQLIWMTNCDF